MVNFTDAIAAYNRAVAKDGMPGLDARDQVGGGDFAALLNDATESAIDALRKGETESLKAAAGTADINEVVIAVSEAEMTLQTVVAVRDKVIQAYQDILRMPI
jgi:flagellar hook-basal body complex protein FliE